MLASISARKTLEVHSKTAFVFKRTFWGKGKSKEAAAVQNEPTKSEPGEGLRSVKTTNVFRAVNFELYAKPVSPHSEFLPLQCATKQSSPLPRTRT